MDKLEKVEKKLNNVEKKFEEDTLAMEMLKELKSSITHQFIVIVVLIIALVGTNLAWIIRENAFETVMESEETTVDGGNGIATYLENSKSGDINYGEDN